jgi:hypothetical protein
MHLMLLVKHMISESQRIEIQTLNEYGIGISKLRQLYRTSPNTIQNILGTSCNNIDTVNTNALVYNSAIADSAINYFIDGTVAKLKPLWTHDRQRLSNFPNLFFIANSNGKLIEYMLFDSTHEYAFNYLQIVAKAQLPISSVIHVDIYSKWLFQQLESRGYVVCHKNKLSRDFPFYHKVEHLFSNIQKAIRRFNRTVKVKELSKHDADKLVIGLVMLYHYNQQHKFIELISELKTKSKLQIEVKQIV